jgi:hypothetical protein
MTSTTNETGGGLADALAASLDTSGTVAILVNADRGAEVDAWRAAYGRDLAEILAEKFPGADGGSHEPSRVRDLFESRRRRGRLVPEA